MRYQFPDKVILGAMGVLLALALVNVALVYRDRRRANRRLIGILAEARRQVQT